MILKNPCPVPFNKLPDIPVNINARENLYYNLLNGKVGVDFLQKVKKEDFYYVLKKFNELDPTKDKIDISAYLQMLNAYRIKPVGQWVIPEIVARECWKLYINEHLHQAVTTNFENDRMLKLIFYFMRFLPDSNLYIDEPGNPTGKIHLIPYLYMYFRNPKIFAIKSKGKDVPLMSSDKFAKIIFALKMLQINMDSPIYQNDAYQGYNKKLIESATDIAYYQKDRVKPMKTVYDYTMVMESMFGTVKHIEGSLYEPNDRLDNYTQLLITILISDYTQFRYQNLTPIIQGNYLKPYEIMNLAYMLDDTTLAFAYGFTQKGIVDSRSFSNYNSNEKYFAERDSIGPNLESIILNKCDNIMNMYVPLLQPTLPNPLSNPGGVQGFEFECREMVTAINNASIDTFKILLEEREFPITYYTVNRIIYYLKKYKSNNWPGYEVYFNMLAQIINRGARFDRYQENVIKNLGDIQGFGDKNKVKFTYLDSNEKPQSGEGITYYAHFMSRYEKLKLDKKICGMPNNAVIPYNIKEYLYCLGIDITQTNQKICKDLVAIREKYPKSGDELDTGKIQEKSLEQNRKYLMNIISNFDLRSGNDMLNDNNSWNAEEYKENNDKVVTEFENMYGFTVRNPLRYNPESLVWFQVEEEIPTKKQKSSEDTSEETSQKQKTGSKFRTYIYPPYRFETLIAEGTYINSKKERIDIPIDVINRMKNKREFFKENNILVSNLLAVSGAVQKLFTVDDTIDNEESEYIFNSMLRLCQSYGYTYTQVLSLTTSEMANILIKYRIILSKSSDEIFRSLSMNPFNDQHT
jgi:hypothetical protein